jgi:hypothetical protein
MAPEYAMNSRSMDAGPYDFAFMESTTTAGGVETMLLDHLAAMPSRQPPS